MTLLTKRKKKKGPASKRTQSRRRIILELDKLIRAAVFERDGNKCVRCGAMQYLTPSHVYPKGTFGNLRYELDNLKTLCVPCHRWWHMNPVEASDWWKKNWPERYEKLCLARHTAPKPDLKALLEEMTLPPHKSQYLDPIPPEGVPF
jgi:5-methylcytosine-specific restriction endonuclease McrA